MKPGHWTIFAVYCFHPFGEKLIIERDSRSQLVTQLQKRGVFSLHLSELRYQAERLSTEQLPNAMKATEPPIAASDLFHYFNQAAILVRRQNDRQFPSQCLSCFLQLLETMNWPGDRTPDSHEYQQTRRWHQVLEQFAGLDKILGEITGTAALQQLESMSKQDVFQPQVADSPLQILGPLEATGLHFTHCWIMGLDQRSWPPPAKPNGLLPIGLQREHQMPHANHLRELAFAASLTEQFRHCAHHLVFSSANYDADTEQTLNVSDLIADIPLSQSPEFKPSDFAKYQQRLAESRQLKTIASHKGPAITTADLTDEGELTGGAGVLKAQAANPFDAFAIYRLNARNPQQPTVGFSALEQGNILHQALADFWLQTKTQAALIGFDPTVLQAKIYALVEARIQQLQATKRQHLGNQLCELETQRQDGINFTVVRV